MKKLSEEEEKDLSSTARELIEYGRKYRVLQLYKKGKISLGKGADELDLPLTEFIDLLNEIGIEANIDYEDYLQGIKNLEEVW